MDHGRDAELRALGPPSAEAQLDEQCATTTSPAPAHTSPPDLTMIPHHHTSPPYLTILTRRHTSPPDITTRPYHQTSPPDLTSIVDHLASRSYSPFAA